MLKKKIFFSPSLDGQWQWSNQRPALDSLRLEMTSCLGNATRTYTWKVMKPWTVSLIGAGRLVVWSYVEGKTTLQLFTNFYPFFFFNVQDF